MKRYSHGTQNSKFMTLNQLKNSHNEPTYSQANSRLIAPNSSTTQLKLKEKMISALNLVKEWYGIEFQNRFLWSAYFPDFLNCLKLWIKTKPQKEEVNVVCTDVESILSEIPSSLVQEEKELKSNQNCLNSKIGRHKEELLFTKQEFKAILADFSDIILDNYGRDPITEIIIRQCEPKIIIDENSAQGRSL